MLIVDNDKNVANSVRRLLSAYDYPSVIAMDVDEAIQTLKDRPDICLVVSDQRLPTASGSDLFTQIAETFPSVKCILLTGYPDVESIRKIVNQGNIFRFLLKPWDDDELLGCVQDAFRIYQVEQENELLKKDLAALNRNLSASIEQKTRVLQMNIQSLKRYETIVDQLPIGIVCIGPDNLVALANRQFCQDFGFSTPVEGIPYQRVLPEIMHPLVENFVSDKYINTTSNGKKMNITTKDVNIDNQILGQLYSIQVERQ